MLSLAIVIPAYNEELTLRQVILDFHHACPDASIVVVDNASTDATTNVARRALAEISGEGRTHSQLIYEKRRGKAAAMRRAFSEVDADVYIMVDADCTYPAGDLAALLQPVQEGRADMVVGNRHAGERYRHENKRPFHNWGNRLVVKLINSLFHGDLEDILSGYRVMTKRFVKTYPILSRGFAIETEMSIHALDKGFRIVEVPTHYSDRPEGSFSKLNTFRDGIRIVRLIFDIFVYFRPFIFFTSLALFLLMASLATGIVPVLEFYRTSYVSHVPLAILASGLAILGLLSLFTGIILDGVARAQRFNYNLQLLQWRD